MRHAGTSVDTRLNAVGSPIEDLFAEAAIGTGTDVDSSTIWTADGTHFPEFIVDGTLIAYHHKADTLFQVRFGTVAGERRAYLTWTDDRLHGAAATVLDVSVDGRGDLVAIETSLRLPGT